MLPSLTAAPRCSFAALCLQLWTCATSCSVVSEQMQLSGARILKWLVGLRACLWLMHLCRGCRVGGGEESSVIQQIPVEANFLLFCLNAWLNDPQAEELSPVRRSDSLCACVQASVSLWECVYSVCVCTHSGRRSSHTEIIYQTLLSGIKET